MLLADLVYNVPANVILDSARRALTGYDVITSMIKAWAFSTAISVVSGSKTLCNGIHTAFSAATLQFKKYDVHVVGTDNGDRRTRIRYRSHCMFEFCFTCT